MANSISGPYPQKIYGTTLGKNVADGLLGRRGPRSLLRSPAPSEFLIPNDGSRQFRFSCRTFIRFLFRFHRLCSQRQKEELRQDCFWEMEDIEKKRVEHMHLQSYESLQQLQSIPNKIITRTMK
ncbi:hypothetical protein CEXT_394951 [Caerostris extrusa]|uniref:Uncharacterized protein n=1 Tax=Caerostris extrusa TaxID=172846 RepID=A0AAV4XNR3_CAEEX|nr:hypothetical protein CEXT_394951 [Caerostris extrusa]